MTNGGFTFHENTPTVTTIQMNPAIDSDLSNELAMINAATACPDHSQVRVLYIILYITVKMEGLYTLTQFRLPQLQYIYYTLQLR